MFRVSVDRGQLNNVEKLATLIEMMPAKIDRANDRAGRKAQQAIEENLRRRGAPGRFVDVTYKKYGPLGLKFSFKTRTGRGGYRGGGNRQYSALWATRVFLNSEQGMTGRRAFTLSRDQKTVNKKGNPSRSGAYRISHSSGQWKKGTTLAGPLRIPAIGPFYFSSKSGMPRKKIQKSAAEIIRNELDKEYRKTFGKIMRSI
jgi:hypothetical protein